MVIFDKFIGEYKVHFASTEIGIDFSADPANIRKLLPESLELSEVDPGGCHIRFSDSLFIPINDEDLIVTNPERTEFKEVALLLNCRVNGIEAEWNYSQWVDKDYAMVGGWFFGCPKKHGNIYLGFSKTRLYEVIPVLGEVGHGTKFTSIVEAHAERIITATVTLNHRISPEELPPSRVRTQTLPSIPFKPKTELSHKLVKTVLAQNAVFGKEIWVGDATHLSFTDSQLAGINSLKPLKTGTAYFYDIYMPMEAPPQLELISEW